jgi:hypothetical protein
MVTTDSEVTEWNEVLARGDEAEIEAAQDRILVAIHRRIMDDDPNYAKAGWRPVRGSGGKLMWWVDEEGNQTGPFTPEDRAAYGS